MSTIKKAHSKVAHKIRKGMSRKNYNGKESTHIFTSGEADGRYYAHPMLFPGYDTGKDTEEWHEFQKGEEDKAFEVARARDEIFEFKTDKEAKDFAKGSWKKKNINKYNHGGKVKSKGLFDFPSKEGRER